MNDPIKVGDIPVGTILTNSDGKKERRYKAVGIKWGGTPTMDFEEISKATEPTRVSLPTYWMLYPGDDMDITLPWTPEVGERFTVVGDKIPLIYERVAVDGYKNNIAAKAIGQPGAFTFSRLSLEFRPVENIPIFPHLTADQMDAASCSQPAENIVLGNTEQPIAETQTYTKSSREALLEGQMETLRKARNRWRDHAAEQLQKIEELQRQIEHSQAEHAEVTKLGMKHLNELTDVEKQLDREKGENSRLRKLLNEIADKAATYRAW